VAVVEEAPNLMACWMKLACLDQAAPKRWRDAYLAALAITGGWRLLTLDRDFLSFVNDGLELQLLAIENR
jgi:predicted nucleic acid-binding protein